VHLTDLLSSGLTHMRRKRRLQRAGRPYAHLT
jgi:hypothetical protein